MDVHFENVEKELKTIEARLWSKKLANVKPGDALNFKRKSDGKKVPIWVGAVCHYRDLDEMIKGDGQDPDYLSKLLPTVKTEEEAKEVYKRIYWYHEKREDTRTQHPGYVPRDRMNRPWEPAFVFNRSRGHRAQDISSMGVGPDV